MNGVTAQAPQSSDGAERRARGTTGREGRAGGVRPALSGSGTRIRITIGPAPAPGSRSGDWDEHGDRRGAVHPGRFTRGPWKRPAAARGWVGPGPAGPRRPPELPPSPAAAGGEVPPPPGQPWLRAAVTRSWPRPGPGEPRGAPGSVPLGEPISLGGLFAAGSFIASLVKGIP